MSPRPRSIADATLISIAANVLARRGVEQTRLADVATESGLAPATLVQRFGSRETLLEAVGQFFTAEVATAFRGRAARPLLQLEEALVSIDVLRHMRFFVSRPAGAGAYSLELRKHIAFSLAEAVEAGELAPCDVATLARRIQLGFYGGATASLLEGTALSGDAIRKVLEEVLADYR